MKVSGSRRLRVALLLPLLVGGGAERVTLNLIEGLEELDCEVNLVVFAARGELVDAVPEKTKLVDLRSGRALLTPLPLARYLRRERPDLLVCVEGHASLAALAAKRLARSGTKLLLTEHIALPKTPTGLKDRVFRRLACATYKDATAVVAVSEGVADSVAAHVGIPRESISVIMNPVLTKRFWKLAEGSVTHAWYQPGQPPVVLGVGRLVPQKDFPNLINAFARVRRERDARLVILGEGPDRKELEALVTDLGMSESVLLPGFVDNPVSYMANSAVFALSSVREGLPTVLIEALAIGTPVVSTDCESGPQEILEGGRLGALVPVGDSGALAAAIIAALDAPRASVGIDVLAPYSPAESARRYLQAGGFDV